MTDVENPSRIGSRITGDGGLDVRPGHDLRVDRLLHQPIVEEAGRAVTVAVHGDEAQHALAGIERLRQPASHRVQSLRPSGRWTCRPLAAQMAALQGRRGWTSRSVAAARAGGCATRRQSTIRRLSVPLPDVPARNGIDLDRLQERQAKRNRLGTMSPTGSTARRSPSGLIAANAARRSVSGSRTAARTWI